MTCPQALPSEICDHHASLILSSLKEYIGIHSIVRDDDGFIVDARLVWWKAPYELIRTSPPRVDQSMRETYFEPEVALEFVREAFSDKRTHQTFVLSEQTVDTYTTQNSPSEMNVTWLRLG